MHPREVDLDALVEAGVEFIVVGGAATAVLIAAKELGRRWRVHLG